MEISEVRVKLVSNKDDRLKAFCSVTMDNEFVVRDIKIIEGSNGFFVAMPSRKLKESCPKCNYRNPVRSKYCNQCGNILPRVEVPSETSRELDAEAGARERQAEHRDIAHPITLEFREYLQKKILEAYESERTKKTADTSGTTF